MVRMMMSPSEELYFLDTKKMTEKVGFISRRVDLRSQSHYLTWK